jgi:protein O-mannosyl-transferase
VGALHNEFVGDDQFLMFRRLAAPDAFSSFARLDYWWPIQTSGLYRPFGLSVLYLERSLFGAVPLGYHCVNLLLHFLNCVLLFRLLKPRVGIATGSLACLLFAAHPIHAEAVLTVYGQLDLLAITLMLSGLLLAATGVGFARHTAAGILFVLAMLTKEIAFVAPFIGAVLLLYGRGKRRPITLAASMAAIAVVLVARAVLLGTVLLPTAATVVGPGGLVLHAKAVLIALGEAIRLCVVPTGQTIYYGHLRTSLFGFPSIETVFVVGGAGAAWLLARVFPGRRVVIGALWFLAGLLPVANLVPIGVLVSERNLYLASFGIAVVAATAITHVQLSGGRRWRVGRRMVLSATMALLLAYPTYRVGQKWRTEESLWRATAQEHPASPKAFAMVGLALIRKGADVQMAQRYLEQALELNPTSGDATYAMGLLLMLRNENADALRFLERAQAMRPNEPDIAEAVQRARERCGATYMK